RQFALAPEQANERLLAVLARLRAARDRRPRPHLDDKILTANNGLMISALARAADGLAEPRYAAAARRAAVFVELELYDAATGTLARAWRDGRGAAPGFAEDYAYFVQGLLDLYEATFELAWLKWAERLQLKMDELFWDEAGGGYFNSAAGDASIVLRLKEDYDGAEPAASSVAALNLFRLAAMLNVEAWRERGRRCVDAFRGQWTRAPHAMPQMLCALELALEPPRHVVLAGDRAAADFRTLAGVLAERLGPRRIVLGLDGGADQAWLAEHAPWLRDMTAQGGRATAYVCEEFACRAPTTSPAELRRLLGP